MMRRTLLITLDYPPDNRGGVANYYYHLVQNLPQHSIVVLDNHAHQLLSLAKFVWPKWLQGLWNVARMVRQEKIEMLIAGQLLPLGTIAWILHHLVRIPYIVMTHGMDVTIPFGPDGSRRKRWLLKHIIRDAYRVTASNTYTRDQLLQCGARPAQLVLVPPGPSITPALLRTCDVRAELIATHHLKVKDRLVLLSVGRLVERKGFDRVIDCLPTLREIFPKIFYVIVGEGEDRQRLETRAREKNVLDHVVFVGACDDATLAAWYDCCNVFVMVSRTLANNDTEGFGLVYLEANSFGKAVVGGLTGGVPDAIIDGETGFLVEPNNQPMICQALVTLLQKPELAQRLGEAGRARVAEHFQWKKTARNLEELLDLLPRPAKHFTV